MSACQRLPILIAIVSLGCSNEPVQGAPDASAAPGSGGSTASGGSAGGATTGSAMGHGGSSASGSGGGAGGGTGGGSASAFGSMGRFILDAAHAEPWGGWYRAGVSLVTSVGPSAGLASSTSGNATIHLTSGTFAQSDVGRIIDMPGAGTNGVAVLVGTIESVSDNLQDATLDVAAGASVTGQPLAFVSPSYRTSFPSLPGFTMPPDVDGMHAAGMRFVPTVLHQAGTQGDPEVPVVDDAAYSAALNEFIDEWHPDALIFGNEVDNPANWPYVEGQGHAVYTHMISVGAAVAHARGLPCGAASIMDYNLKQAVYRWLDQTVGHDEAETFRQQMNGFAFDASRADKADQYVDDVKSAACDAMVWHFYQDGVKGTSGDATEYLALPRYKQYFEARFGGANWNNEWGNRSNKVWGEMQAENDLRHLIQGFHDLGIDMAVAYGSGDGPNGPDQLWQKTGTDMGAPTAEGQVGIDTIATLP